MSAVVRLVLRRSDATIAAALLAMGLIEALLLSQPGPAWRQALLTPVWTVPLVWRRRWPVVVLALVMPMGPTLDLINSQGGVMSFVLAAVLASYTVGRELDPPAAWWGPALTVGLAWVAYTLMAGQLSDFVFVALLYGGAWAVGYAIHRRDLQVDELAEETEELRRQQSERQRRAVEEERVRIARELHDIVSHSISVIAIQTQAVRRRLGPQNAAEIEVLRTMETTARQAMAELRRLLGVLRAQSGPAELAPQPGLDQLPQLVEETRATGAVVDLQVDGERVRLPAGVDLAAFRIIQEAMTNARKHAGAGHLSVLVRCDPRRVELQVDDDGSGSDAQATNRTSDGGYGLAGMRERVSLYGGTLAAGPRPGGGFRVQATLPLGDGEAEGT